MQRNQLPSPIWIVQSIYTLEAARIDRRFHTRDSMDLKFKWFCAHTYNTRLDVKMAVAASDFEAIQ